MANKKKDSPQEADTAPKKGPVDFCRIEDCSASIWARKHVVQGVDRTFYSVTFERSYTDKAGTRRYTGFFAPDNLGKLVALCQKVEQKIRTLQ